MKSLRRPPISKECRHFCDFVRGPLDRVSRRFDLRNRFRLAKRTPGSPVGMSQAGKFENARLI